MQFKLATLVAGAALASATNTITFMSLDSTARTVYFTGNPGTAEVQPATIPGNQNVTVEIPQSWTGNFYSVSDGAANVPGMLGEVSFNSWSDLSFFDVSAIVNSDDVNGVKMLFPAQSGLPTSGCNPFPCDNAYYSPDQVQTKATDETALICTLGTGTLERRDINANVRSPLFTRDFAMGEWTD